VGKFEGPKLKRGLTGAIVSRNGGTFFSNISEAFGGGREEGREIENSRPRNANIPRSFALLSQRRAEGEKKKNEERDRRLPLARAGKNYR